METFFTVAVYLFGALFIIVCEFLDTFGRLQIVESGWPKIYKAMSNRPMRLVLLVFLIALAGKDLAERAKEKRDVPALAVNFPAPPAPIVQMFSANRSDHPTASIKQTLVENHGQITGGQINGNTQISGTDTPRKQIATHVGRGVHGRVPDITGVRLCTGDDWKCFLREEESHAKSGDVTAFEETINVFSNVVDLRGRVMVLRGNKEAKQQCDQEFTDAVALHAQDESDTIKTLLIDPPACLKQQ